MAARSKQTQCYGYVIKPVGTVGSLDQRWIATRRPSLDPHWLDPVLGEQFPASIPWPDGDLETLIACIKALYHQDHLTLQTIKAAHPRHAFGFETYLGWVVAKINAAGHTSENQTKVVPSDESGITHRDVITRRVLRRGIWVEFQVARFKSGDAWGIALFRTRTSTLTKAWVDLITKEATVFAHFPGRWKALGVNPRIIQQVIGPYSIPMITLSKSAVPMVLASAAPETGRGSADKT